MILVGSGPFEEEYVPRLQENRFSRLNKQEQEEFQAIVRALNDSEIKDGDKLLARLGELASKTAIYAPIECEEEDFELGGSQGAIFQGVWTEAAELRRNGMLLAQGEHISCSVVAIHGDYDPHPWEGVQEPLSAIMSDFRFVLLEQCGHKPWVERYAREEFFQILNDELH